MSKIKVFYGTTSENLARGVCRHLSIPPGEATLKRFADGEINAQLNENVRGSDVFIIGATNPPAENLLEMLLFADAARRSSAERITVIPIYLGYNRQDRKDRPRVPISARVVIDMFSNSGANRVLLFDIHSEPTMGFFSNAVVVDHLYAAKMIVPYLQGLLKEPYVVASPDKGGVPRARAYADKLGKDDGIAGDFVVFNKVRPRPGSIDSESIRIIGDVTGRDVLFVTTSSTLRGHS